MHRRRARYCTFVGGTEKKFLIRAVLFLLERLHFADHRDYVLDPDGDCSAFGTYAQAELANPAKSDQFQMM